ncbi:MAG: hypothetical protein WCP61_07565 [Chitinophagia bacterium]
MKRKLDLFNFFYSLGAVIILLGVIGKLLEWEVQDVLMTVGLSMEIFIFALSSIKFNETKEDSFEDVETENVALPFQDSNVGSTYINIQNGIDANFSPSNTSLTDYKSYLDTADSFSIDLNIGQFGNLNILSNLSQLDKIIALSQVKDLLYEPDWYQLHMDDYEKLIILIKNIFGMRMPNYEFLPILIQTPIKLPTPNYAQFSILDSIELTQGEIELLCKAFALVNDYHFLDNFVFQESNHFYYIRAKQKDEIQVYGGENEVTLLHIDHYYKSKYIISPKIKAIKDLVFSYDTGLIVELVNSLKFDQLDEFVSLNKLVTITNDKTRSILFQCITPFHFVFNNERSYNYFQEFVKLALSFDDKIRGYALFENAITYQKKNEKYFSLNEVVNYNSESIYFGVNNEYTLSIKDIFLPDQLDNLQYVYQLVDNLKHEQISSKEPLDLLFGIQVNDIKKEIYLKLNQFLDKSKLTPNGSQLAYILLYKQYNSLN